MGHPAAEARRAARGRRAARVPAPPAYRSAQAGRDVSDGVSDLMDSLPALRIPKASTISYTPMTTSRRRESIWRAIERPGQDDDAGNKADDTEEDHPPSSGKAGITDCRCRRRPRGMNPTAIQIAICRIIRSQSGRKASTARTTDAAPLIKRARSSQAE